MTCIVINDVIVYICTLTSTLTFEPAFKACNVDLLVDSLFGGFKFVFHIKKYACMYIKFNCHHCHMHCMYTFDVGQYSISCSYV